MWDMLRCVGEGPSRFKPRIVHTVANDSARRIRKILGGRWMALGTVYYGALALLLKKPFELEI